MADGRQTAGKRRGVTRRQLLRGLSALGGAGAAYMGLRALGLLGVGRALAQGAETTAPLPAGSLAGKRVVVIGAGLAGLCAALRLVRAGAEVEILEATDRVGGRSLTLRQGDSYREWDWNSPTTMRFEAVGDVPADDPGNYLNAGPGRIPQHHARVIDYCRELGVPLQPFIFYDAANLVQNDAWNGGRPVQLRRLKHDLRGHLAELLAKVRDQGALDRVLDPAEAEAFLGMLQQFGQLSAEGSELVYKGAATLGYPRAGYRIEPGSVAQPGQPWPTLSLEEILQSDLWAGEMFNNLEYDWQATLLEPVGGMDRIVEGFRRAPLGDQRVLGDLVLTGQPVTAIELEGGKATVVTPDGPRPPADYVVATLASTLIARLEGNFLSPPLRQVLAGVDFTPACKVGWQARRRFWEEDDRIYGGISWTKDIISQVWYPSYGFNGPTGVLTGAYNRHADAEEFGRLSRAERLERALEGGEKLHPGFRDEVFAGNGVSIAWARMPYQVGGWADDTFLTQPEVFAAMADADPLGGRVFLAGDWFSHWPGWQVGSLDSAHLATDGIHRRAAGRG